MKRHIRPTSTPHFKIRWTNHWLPYAQLDLNDFNQGARREPRPHIIPATPAAIHALRVWYITPVMRGHVSQQLCFGTAILPSGMPVIAFRFKRHQRPGFAGWLLGVKRELDEAVESLNLSTPEPVTL